MITFKFIRWGYIDCGLQVAICFRQVTFEESRSIRDIAESDIALLAYSMANLIFL